MARKAGWESCVVAPVAACGMRRRYMFLLTAMLVVPQLIVAGPSRSPLPPALLEQMGFGTVEVARQASPAGDVVVTTLQASPKGSRAGLQFVWVEIRRVQPSMDVRPVLQYGNSFQVIAAATPPDVVAAINGGFFGYDAKGGYAPLGLVVSEGQTRNHKAAWRGGGILYQDGSRHLHVVSPQALAPAARPVSAIQSKPVLVQDAKLAIRSDDGERFNRSAVLITTSGEVILAGAFHSFGRAMAMKEFARAVAAIRSSSGAAVQVGLAMDGGPGAQLYVPALKLHFGDPGNNFVPNLVQFGR